MVALAMIIFHISSKRVPAGHTADESLMLRTSRWWTCSDKSLVEHGDFALAVSEKIVIGIYRINGWSRDPDEGGKVVLDLEELQPLHPLRAWVGRATPVQRKPGEQVPFKYITMRGAAFAPGLLIEDGVHASLVVDEFHVLQSSPETTAQLKALVKASRTPQRVKVPKIDHRLEDLE